MGLAQLIADTLTNICRPLQTEGFVAKGHGHYTIYSHTHCLIVTEYLSHMHSWCLFVPKKILSNDVMCQKLKYSFLWSTTGTVSIVDLCQVIASSETKLTLKSQEAYAAHWEDYLVVRYLEELTSLPFLDVCERSIWLLLFVHSSPSFFFLLNCSSIDFVIPSQIVHSAASWCNSRNGMTLT